MAATAEAPTTQAPEQGGPGLVTGLFDKLQADLPSDPRKPTDAGKPTVTTAPNEPAKSAGESEVEKQKATEVQKDQKPEEVPAEQTPEAEAEPANLDEKGRYKWGELKKENKTQKARIEELQKQIKERGESTEELTRVKGELETLQKQIEDANKELYIHRVEATPEWNKGVIEPLDDVFNQVDTIAKTNKLDPNSLFEAVHKYSKGEKETLKGLLEGMDEFDRADLHALSKNLVNIQKRRDDLKANSREAYETSMRNEKELSEKQSQEIVQQYEKAVTSVGTKFKEKFGSLLPEDAPIDYAKVGMESRQIDSWTPEMKVYAGHAAVMIPELVKLTESLQKQVKEQSAELAKFRNGAPKANTAGTAPTSPAEAKPKQTREELAFMSWEDMAGGILKGSR